MGAKTWMLVYTEGDAREALRRSPALDRGRSLDLARRLFPDTRLIPLEDGDLCFTCPPSHEVCIACFPGVSIAAASEFGIDFPSRLPQKFIDAGGARTVWLHAMHSVVDWFGFAQWTDGLLIRSLSVSPESGVIEDIGAKLPFELPFWAGERPAVNESDDDPDHPYPLPFHPLELGEAVLSAVLGFQYEGVADPAHIDPGSIPMCRFTRSRPRWRFWR